MSKIVVMLLLGGSLFTLNAFERITRPISSPTQKERPDFHSDRAGARLFQDADEENVEEELEQSDALKDPEKAKLFLAKAKEMMELVKKAKDEGDEISADQYQNMAIAYGLLSEGYRIGNQRKIDKGNKLLAIAQKRTGE